MNLHLSLENTYNWQISIFYNDDNNDDEDNNNNNNNIIIIIMIIIIMIIALKYKDSMKKKVPLVNEKMCSFFHENEKMFPF